MPDDTTYESRATGSDRPSDTEILPMEEPDVRGTLFLMIVFLMAIFGFWAMMYVQLLSRQS